MVYSSSTASAIDNEDAQETFFGSTGSASGASIAIAVAMLFAAACCTGCAGITLGRCWLRKERRLRGDDMAEAAVAAMKHKASSDRAQHAGEPGGGGGTRCGNGSGGRGGKGGRGGGTSSSTSEGGIRRSTHDNENDTGQNNVFGNLAPSVPVGILHIGLPDVSGQSQQGCGHGHGRCYDEKNGSERSGGGAGSGRRAEPEHVLEHDYGDTGRAEVSGGGGGGGGVVVVFL